MEYRNDRTFGVTAGRAAAGAALVAVFGVAWLGGTYSAGERLASTEVQVERSYLAQALSGKDASGDFVLAGKDWDMSNLDHYRVDHWIAHFTGPKRDDFRRFLERSGRYGPMIQQELAGRDMPQDLIYLAMIESGMNPEAYSHAHAAGLWQFIAETGSRYGLTVNSVVDERYDPVKATQAGLDYLTYLHNRFGSWYLAAAGYNTGENRVGRIMREVTGSEKGTDEDFYRIWDRLPRETRDYVPLMVAAARIAKEPAKYGFDDVQFQPTLAFDEVEAEPGTYLSAVAQAVGIELTELRRYNPHLRNQRVPTNRTYLVRLPEGLGTRFAQSIEAIQAAQAEQVAAVQQYRVRRGDNLGAIAQRHGTSVAAIRSANNLRGDRIIAGQNLTIPGP
jgi:membrane-bound lytic murein transglycosylase D